MVVGVSVGFKSEIVSVGYKAVKVGKTIQLYLGHSLMETDCRRRNSLSGAESPSKSTTESLP